MPALLRQGSTGQLPALGTGIDDVDAVVQENLPSNVRYCPFPAERNQLIRGFITETQEKLLLITNRFVGFIRHLRPGPTPEGFLFFR
jgi:hypothetical protein